jgi:hypothetical protein
MIFTKREEFSGGRPPALFHSGPCSRRRECRIRCRHSRSQLVALRRAMEGAPVRLDGEVRPLVVVLGRHRGQLARRRRHRARRRLDAGVSLCEGVARSLPRGRNRRAHPVRLPHQQRPRFQHALPVRRPPRRRLRPRQLGLPAAGPAPLEWRHEESQPAEATGTDSRKASTGSSVSKG